MDKWKYEMEKRVTLELEAIFSQNIPREYYFDKISLLIKILCIKKFIKLESIKFFNKNLEWIIEQKLPLKWL